MALRYRFACMLVVAGAASAAGAGVSAQSHASAPATGGWTLGRLPDGHPDFQGVWANNTVTPLQRRHRSEEHTSELQSQFHLVCRLLLEKKNTYHAGSARGLNT